MAPRDLRTSGERKPMETRRRVNTRRRVSTMWRMDIRKIEACKHKRREE